MKRLPFATVVLALVAVLLPGRAALAQPAADPAPDTIRVDDGPVVIELKNGERVLIQQDGERHGEGPHVYVLDPENGETRVFIDRDGEEDVLRPRHRRFAISPAEPWHVEIPELHGLEGLNRSLVEMHRDLVDPAITAVRVHSDVARLEMEAHRLAKQAREAEGGERERLERELEEKLAEIFERKQELREERIEDLQGALEAERAQQQDRERARQEIIERRLRELLGDEDVLDW